MKQRQSIATAQTLTSRGCTVNSSSTSTLADQGKQLGMAMSATSCSERVAHDQACLKAACRKKGATGQPMLQF
jgi:hypothetical protein